MAGLGEGEEDLRTRDSEDGGCLEHREGKTEGQRDRGTMAAETERQRRRVSRPQIWVPCSLFGSY